MNFLTFTVHYQDSFFSSSFLQEPKELLETTDKIANKLVQQIQSLKQRSKKCGENTRSRQRDGALERSESQRLVPLKICASLTTTIMISRLGAVIL
jgi:hypothetical protein